MDGHLNMSKVPLVQFTVPGVPVGKGRPRGRIMWVHKKNQKVPTVQLYTPSKTRHYEELVSGLAKSAMGHAEPTPGPVHVTFVALFPVPQGTTRRDTELMIAGHKACDRYVDLDNLEKAINDGMNKIVYRDDRQIVSNTCLKDWTLKEPRVLVRVHSLRASDLLEAAA